jgi:branched-chain amino acid transport system substrate-binding protein
MMKGHVPNQFAADGYDVIYAIYNACVATGVNGNTSANEACAKLCEYFKTATYNGLTGANLTWDAAGMVSKNPEAIVVKDGKYTPLG